MELKGSRVDAGVGSGNASDLSEATGILVEHTDSTSYLVSVEDEDGTLIGTINLPAAAGAVLYLWKKPSDKIFSTNAAVKFTSVIFKG